MGGAGARAAAEGTDADPERTVALVGAGKRARQHLEPYAAGRIEGAEPVACAAPGEENREALAADFGLDAYADTRRMLAAVEPDLVHVTTPPDVRVEPLKAVAAAGVPACTVEKPVALGVADWRELGDLVGADTRIAVCHQFRWDPRLVRVREAVASGRVGAVTALDASARLTLTDQGTHCLHYANSLAGDRRIEAVSGTVRGPFRDGGMHPGPAATAASVRLAGGLRMRWRTGEAAPYCGDPTTEYQHVRAAAFGGEGHAAWAEFGSREVVGREGVDREAFPGEEAYREGRERAQAAFHRAALDWLAGGDPPGTHLQRSLREWKAVLALYASSLRGEPVALEGFDPDPGLVDRVRDDLGSG